MGKSPSHIVSAVTPEEIPAEGSVLILIVVGADRVIHPCAFVASTVTC